MRVRGWPVLLRLAMSAKAGPEGVRSGRRRWQLRYLPDQRLFQATSHSGKISQTLGVYRDGKYLLSAPEAFYLLSGGRARLMGEETDQAELYWAPRLLAAVGGNSSLLHAFCRLKDIGYILTSTSSPRWEIYSPNDRFKKTDPPPPLGVLSFVPARETLFDMITARNFPDRALVCAFSEASFAFLQVEWTDLDT